MDGLASDYFSGRSNVEVYDAAALVTKDLSGLFLDAGAGVGDFTRVLLGQGHVGVYACDIEVGSFSVDGVVCVRCDLNVSLPYRSGSFDVVVALEVVEHLENPRFFLREVGRVLRCGGRLVLSTPNVTSLRSRLSFLFKGFFTQFTNNSVFHITVLTKRDLYMIMSAAGFVVERVSYTNSGKIPKLNVKWQSVSHLFGGELFSDNVLLLCMRV
jgi:2-polyprenyl-3-methyl-5-hydroxy-6-metoxy-1,4-benzoquinol methylase